MDKPSNIDDLLESAPKIFDLDEINLQNSEWQSFLETDNEFVDEDVLGSLFKLGDNH